VEELYSTWAAVKRYRVAACEVVVWLVCVVSNSWVGVGGVVEIIPNRINRVRGPDLKHRFPRLLSGRFEASRAN
jgi:hypothetical protein